MLWADVKNVFVLATAAVTAGYGAHRLPRRSAQDRGPQHAGLPGRYKLLGQFLIGGVVIGYLFLSEAGLPPEWIAIRARLSIPFVAFAKHPIELPLWVYIAFALLLVVFTSNAVNLTDGLDGLAIGPVMIDSGTYMIWAYIAGLVLFGQHMARYLDIPGIHRDGRARRVWRRGDRGGHRLPLVQHLSGPSVHGGRRVAVAGRRPRA